MSWENLAWDTWLYGLFAAFIGGGAGAVTSGVTVSTMDPKDFALGSWGSIRLMIAVFVVNGFINFFAFLHQTPLPTIKTVSATITTEKTGAGIVEPITTVVHRTETTKIEAAPKTNGKDKP